VSLASGGCGPELALSDTHLELQLWGPRATDWWATEESYGMSSLLDLEDSGLGPSLTESEDVIYCPRVTPAILEIYMCD
jgi:hypothetical protein